jgi:hypothetical protein
MTSNTTEGRADASSGAVIDQPIASQTPPEGAVPPAAAEADLESRITQRRAEVIEKIGGLRGDMRPEAIESRKKLKAKLSELTHVIKWGVPDGWASLGAPLTNKLEQWLAESARQLITKNDHSS